MPVLTCTSAYRGIAPVAGVNVGVLYSSAFLFTACRHGKAAYFAAVVINGNETNYPRTPFHAGNLIQVSTKVTLMRTTVSVTDLTTGVTKKRTGPASSTPNSAYVGDGQLVANGRELRVPNFGTLTFSHSSINGKPLARWHPARYRRTLANIAQITAGSLTAGGTAFPTHFKHS
jgi:hypothetical protein